MSISLPPLDERALRRIATAFAVWFREATTSPDDRQAGIPSRYNPEIGSG